MIPTLILSDIIRHKKCPKRFILKMIQVLVKNSVITIYINSFNQNIEKGGLSHLFRAVIAALPPQLV